MPEHRTSPYVASARPPKSPMSFAPPPSLSAPNPFAHLPPPPERLSRRRALYATPEARRVHIAPDVDLRVLTTHDPRFDPQSFVDYAVTVFFTVHRAVQPNACVGPARRMVSEDLWCQLHVANRGNQESLLPLVGNTETTIEVVMRDDRWESIVVRFAIAADSLLGTFAPHEYWVFRRPACTSRAEREPEACPTCGAPMRLDRDGRCVYCDVPLAGNRHGWRAIGMMAGMLGVGSGHPLDAEQLPRVRALLDPIVASDPDFDVIEFLAFAPSAFARVRAALARVVERSSIRALVSAEHFDEIQTSAGGPLVGSVNKIEIVRADHQDSVDTIVIRFAASTPAVSSLKVSHQFHQLATFQRRRGTELPVRRSSPGPHCASCGSPLDLNDDGTCRHCRALHGGNRTGWEIVAMRCKSPPGETSLYELSENRFFKWLNRVTAPRHP